MNFIFFSSGGYYKSFYNDLLSLNNFLFIDDFMKRKNVISSIFYRYILFYNRKNPLARYLSLILFPYIYIDKFNEDRRCFMFDERTAFLINCGYLNFLKSTYPDSCFICILHDKMSTIRNVSAFELKLNFDIVYSYDYNDVIKHNFTYRTTSYSKIDKFYFEGEADNDVIFIGQAKDRLDKIFFVYHELIRCGLKCEFYLINVNKELKIWLPGVYYVDWMDYSTVLTKNGNTKCILELMQKDSQNITYRTWEAILYDKFLLTDNDFLFNSPFYSEGNMYNILDGIDSFATKIKGRKAKYSNKEQLSPFNLINEIENKVRR